MNKQEYLDTKLKPIMQNLVFQLVLERPDDPASFMIDWLQKTGGYTSSGLNAEEKEELANLRKEVAQLKSEINSRK